MAWVVDNTDMPDRDPNLPDPSEVTAHRIGLTTGTLVCQPWVTAAAGRRIPETRARAAHRMCRVCWPNNPKEQ
ncbi:hypothetical protein ACIODS_11970 [Micromonospora chalcea]|uniref:hypothetical protein n=1 Tax=Micromonospora chalcea TaxID=1874 RepID=UPI0038001CB4